MQPAGAAMDSGDELDPAVRERVRRELVRLGTDEASAPDVPAAVTARVGDALQAAGQRPAHSIRVPRLRRLQVFGLVVGLGAALAGVIVGASMLARGPASTLSRGPTAESITVSRPALPLSDHQLVGMLSGTPDYGPLADPQRRASCLDGLGYPATARVLGARPIAMDGRPAVLMLLPGDTPQALVALVVDPGCNAAHTGLLANTVVTRP
jgi:hypothetical protein